MNKLIKGLIVSVLAASIFYIGFGGYISTKVNQEVTDLRMKQLQSQIDYLNEQQIRDNTDINIKLLQFQSNNNEKFINMFENLTILAKGSIKNFINIYKKLREPDINLLLKSSVIVQTPLGSGSGTVIKKDNGFIYILTCYHVIEEGINPPELFQTVITVSYLLKNKNDEEIAYIIHGAEIIKYDKENDIALLRIFAEDENLNIVSIAKEEPKIGDIIYSVGNPLSTNRILSKGILSGKEENFYISDNTTTFGNSGGGLFNNKGELIGIPSNVMIYIFDIPESSLGLSRNLQTIKDFLKGVDY